MLIPILMILGGLVGLGLGGELLVRGAVGIARKLGMSSLVTGIVIVGSATSMPELVASIEASMQGSSDMAWGNILGSNIANTLLILGTAVVVAPIVLNGMGRRDALVGFGAVLLLWLCGLAEIATPLLGAGLLVLLAIYIFWRVKHPPESDHEDEEDAPSALWLSIVLFAIGVGALIYGGQILVSGAIDIARLFAIPETTIGLTIVAIGTSLPELAATLAAALRGKPGLAVGNVVGSNIYNLLLIGGTTMVIAPGVIPAELLDVEILVLAASALMLLLLTRYVKRIGRSWGLVLLAAFAANTALAFY